MRTTIDHSGRLVVPKPLRDQLRLEGGTQLEVFVRGDQLVVEPVATPMRLVRRGKGLVAVTDEPLPKLTAEEVRSVIETVRR
jgi:AbrB family looped-hinge helix DNA binding protein